MELAIILAAALAAQPAMPVADAASNVENVDVAYTELANGHDAEALRKLERSALVQAHDPGALINLGTAYARAGDEAKARASFAAAMASRDRYVLELADGTWVESQVAARMANAALGTGTILAQK
jgi:Tfp pilus assembly protein PilF